MLTEGIVGLRRTLSREIIVLVTIGAYFALMAFAFAQALTEMDPGSRTDGAGNPSGRRHRHIGPGRMPLSAHKK